MISIENVSRRGFLKGMAGAGAFVLSARSGESAIKPATSGVTNRSAIISINGAMPVGAVSEQRAASSVPPWIAETPVKAAHFAAWKKS